jgi:5-methylcytosine-specific restriction endonuclease McrA
MAGGWIDRKTLPKGVSGRSLCRWCSLEVPKGRFTFCSDWCVNEWKLRTNPGYLREQVFQRDRGVCAQCGLDCVAELYRLKRSRGARSLALWAQWSLKPRQRASLWDSDHIVPVVEGGGECNLSNIRTLCLRCHRAVTVELNKRRQGSRGLVILPPD